MGLAASKRSLVVVVLRWVENVSYNRTCSWNRERVTQLFLNLVSKPFRATNAGSRRFHVNVHSGRRQLGHTLGRLVVALHGAAATAPNLSSSQRPMHTRTASTAEMYSVVAILGECNISAIAQLRHAA